MLDPLRFGAGREYVGLSHLHVDVVEHTHRATDPAAQRVRAVEQDVLKLLTRPPNLPARDAVRSVPAAHVIRPFVLLPIFAPGIGSQKNVAFAHRFSANCFSVGLMCGQSFSLSRSFSSSTSA